MEDLGQEVLCSTAAIRFISTGSVGVAAQQAGAQPPSAAGPLAGSAAGSADVASKQQGHWQDGGIAGDAAGSSSGRTTAEGAGAAAGVDELEMAVAAVKLERAARKAQHALVVQRQDLHTEEGGAHACDPAAQAFPEREGPGAAPLAGAGTAGAQGEVEAEAAWAAAELARLAELQAAEQKKQAARRRKQQSAAAQAVLVAFAPCNRRRM